MSHWDSILDYLDSLTVARLATLCKLFSEKEHENSEKCQDEINYVSKALLNSSFKKFESTFQCSIYKNKIHKVKVENKTISVSHIIYK
jgi:uncharacterized Ntn-hydrolase superfamily protein